MDNETIQLAIDKKYSDFSDKVKAALNTKMSNHPTMKQHTDDISEIKEYKKIFSQISSNGEEE